MSVLLLVSHIVYFPDPYDERANRALVNDSTELTTDTWALFDPETGTILEGDHTHDPRPIASVTKLFTAYAALESTKRNAPTTITWSDLNAEGQAGKLYYGERTTPYDLLFPLLIESSNDASEAIRRAIGNEFDDSLLSIQNELSLTQTKIVEPSGLSAENVSPPDDLARFYAYLRKTHPHILDITQLRVYVSESAGLVNNDPARALATFTGGKHGYTPEADRTFVGTFTLPQSGKEVGVVLLGSSDLVSDINTVLDRAAHRL